MVAKGDKTGRKKGSRRQGIKCLMLCHVTFRPVIILVFDLKLILPPVSTYMVQVNSPIAHDEVSTTASYANLLKYWF